MSEIKCIFNVLSEHDMDMLFLQLFSIDSGFARLFLNAASFHADDFSIDSIELSKSDPKLGESDITVLLTAGKKKVALLIEDKIAAIAMQEQASRYIQRGDKGKRKVNMIHILVLLFVLRNTTIIMKRRKSILM